MSHNADNDAARIKTTCETWPVLPCACRGGQQAVGAPCSRKRERDQGAALWAVRAENGLSCYTSEEVARVAVAEGYTLGPDRSPIVAVATRSSPDAEWTHVIPPGKGETA